MTDDRHRILSKRYTVAQIATMDLVYADGATVPCGHPPPCAVTVTADGVAQCHDCGMTYSHGNLTSWAKVPEDERANFLELLKLGAKPWRGTCPLCPWTLWFADTEERAHELVSKHILADHTVRPNVWKDHDA